jgi:hypothetical protein
MLQKLKLFLFENPLSNTKMQTTKSLIDNKPPKQTYFALFYRFICCFFCPHYYLQNFVNNLKKEMKEQNEKEEKQKLEELETKRKQCVDILNENKNIPTDLRDAFYEENPNKLDTTIIRKYNIEQKDTSNPVNNSTNNSNNDIKIIISYLIAKNEINNKKMEYSNETINTYYDNNRPNGIYTESYLSAHSKPQHPLKRINNKI